AARPDRCTSTPRTPCTPRPCGPGRRARAPAADRPRPAPAATRTGRPPPARRAASTPARSLHTRTSPARGSARPPRRATPPPGRAAQARGTLLRRGRGSRGGLGVVEAVHGACLERLDQLAVSDGDGRPLGRIFHRVGGKPRVDERSDPEGDH